MFTNFDLELLSMFGVGVPVPLQSQVLTRREFRQVADHCGKSIETQTGNSLLSGTLWKQAQYCISIFWIVISDSLDGAREGVHRIKFTFSGRDRLEDLAKKGTIDYSVG